MPRCVFYWFDYLFHILVLSCVFSAGISRTFSMYIMMSNDDVVFRLLAVVHMFDVGFIPCVSVLYVIYRTMCIADVAFYTIPSACHAWYISHVKFKWTLWCPLMILINIDIISCVFYLYISYFCL